jgi:hypothetical protein
MAKPMDLSPDFKELIQLLRYRCSLKSAAFRLLVHTRGMRWNQEG